MTRNRFLFVVLVVALLISVFNIFSRHQIEKNNEQVELIMDYYALNEIEEGEENLVERLQQKGLTAVAVYSLTFEELVDREDIIFFTGGDLVKIERLTGTVSENLKSFSYTADSAFFIIDDNFLKEAFTRRKEEWSEKYNFEYEENGKSLTIFIPEWKDDYLTLNCGFDTNLIENIRAKGLKIVLRPSDSKINNDYILSQLDSISPEYVVFQGEQVTGFPDNLEATARVLLRNDILFGMIEPFIARQEGAQELSYLMDFNLSRVHSIQQEEMDYRENYSMENIADRYLRAVRERNVRLLYLRPFFEEKDGASPQELTVDYIEKLTFELKESGFTVGNAERSSGFGNSYFALLVISIGIITAGIILLEKLMYIKLGDNVWIIMGAFILVEIIMIFTGRIFLLRKLLAFSSSLIFPSLAVITQIQTENRRNGIVFRFLKASFISLVGAFLLAASLAHTAFILNVDQFRGVKLSFILPLIIISIYYFMSVNLDEEKDLSNRIKVFLNSNVKTKHVILITLAALIAVFYILRSGNNPLFTVPDVELLIRDQLEKILVIRPRFKAFLIGHPFLILTLGLLARKNNNRLSYYPLIMLGSIGQITILNTFSHIHTPVKVSLIRVFHGLWLGLIFGIVLYLIVRILSQYVKKKRAEEI